MKAEKARDLLAMIEIKEPNELVVNSWWGSFVKDYKDALQTAIKALEQQPCEDCISRQAVLNGLASIAKVKASSDAQKSLMGRVMFFTEQLPPVTPKEKTGKWIDEADDIDAQFGRHEYKCSVCGRIANYYVGGNECWWDIYKPNFCPNCGARMFESQESEG